MGDLAAATTWRDLISSKSVPRINEFPSLGYDNSGLSLASIGEAISNYSTGTWLLKKETKINNENQNSEPVNEFPDLPKASSNHIFNNSKESLSLLNKNKSRYKKFFKQL